MADKDAHRKAIKKDKYDIHDSFLQNVYIVLC